MTRPQEIVRGFRWLLLSVVALGGCSQIVLPAIDPTGERIFAPAPTYTTLTTPVCPLPDYGWWPEPVFAAPPEPPPCPPGMVPAMTTEPPCPPLDVAVPAAAPAPPPPAPAPQGALVVTPTRIVAPVGGEVILTAGFCSGKGYYVTDQPVEWMLSQDSVGQFVEASGDGDRWVYRLLRGSSPGKVDGDYAVVRTCAKTQLITRGTPTPSDDVLVQRGQTWISVTSATEGASRITVVAPQAGPWDQRRRTATIHWIDAQWTLPSPAVVRSGERHVLTTTVTHNSGAAPSPPWRVRYEVAGGAPAAFAPSGQAAVEVATDSEGRASVELLPHPGAAGTTRVRIQIIRPAISSGDLPRTILGEGWTTVTWSAPGLAVAIRGPQIASAGAGLTYRIDTTNPGSLTTSDVVVSLTLPPGIAFLNSNTPNEVFGDRLQWRLGDLAAGASRSIEVHCRAQRAGSVRLRVEARGGSLRAESEAATQIIAPELRLTMKGPKQAAVGDRVQFQIEVSNIGPQSVSNVTITDRFDAGLEHSEQQTSPIVRSLGDLAPGQTRRIAVTFIVRRPGRLCHTVEVRSDDGPSASEQACLEAAAASARPELQVAKKGPDQRRAGEMADYVITVTNTGDTPLTQVRIVDQYAPSLQPKQASPDFQITAGQLVWVIERLAPGETQTRQVNCLCLKPDPAARNRVAVTAAEPVSQSAEAITRILPAEAAAPPQPLEREPGEVELNGARPPAAGKLNVTVAETNNPIKVGEHTTYVIVIENDRDVSDKNVVLKITLPDGMKYVRFKGGFADTKVTDGGRTVEVPAIAEIRPREKLAPFYLEVEAVAAGALQLKVEVASQRLEQPLQVLRETTVFAE